MEGAPIEMDRDANMIKRGPTTLNLRHVLSEVGLKKSEGGPIELNWGLQT